MKAVILCRVSSREQEEEGYSLQSQEKLLIEYRDKKGFSKDRIVSFAETASKKDQRKEFDAMIAYMKKQGIKILICEKVDRLLRNLEDAVIVNKWLQEDEEHQVHCVKENVALSRNSSSNEKFIWNIKVSVAQYYTDNLSEEVRKGQKEMIAQGVLPTKPPVGYVTVGEKGRRIHVPDPSKKHLAIKMFEYYDSGLYSTNKLHKQMKEDGLTNYNGNTITASRIHELLQDPFYIGKIRWNGIVTDGAHEAIISEELFNRVQARMKRKNAPKYNKHFYLFKGLIRCSDCKGVITWEEKKGHIYGHCNHHRPCNQDVWAKENEVEKQLLAEFSGLKLKDSRLLDWIGRALKESHKDEVEYYTLTVDEIQKKVRQIDNRLSKLYDDKADGSISKEFHDKKFKEYTLEKEQLLGDVAKHSNAHNKYHDLCIKLFELAQKAQEIYVNAEKENKRDLLSLVFSELYLDNGKVTYNYTKAFSILRKVVELTNCSKVDIPVVQSVNIFELDKVGVTKQKDQPFGVGHPAWLPG